MKLAVDLKFEFALVIDRGKVSFLRGRRNLSRAFEFGKSFELAMECVG